MENDLNTLGQINKKFTFLISINIKLILRNKVSISILI